MMPPRKLDAFYRAFFFDLHSGSDSGVPRITTRA